MNSEKFVSLQENIDTMAEKFTFTYGEKQKMAAQTAEILTEEIPGLPEETVPETPENGEGTKFIIRIPHHV